MAGIQSWFGGARGTDNVARDNCLFDNPETNVDISGGGFTANANVIANPRFHDAARGDYRLDPGSPCLAIVGYDTAAKLDGALAQPAPAATATPTATATTTSAPNPTATATTTAVPSATATPTTAPPAPSPTATPTTARTPAPTAAATQTQAPVATETPAPAATVPSVSQPPVAGSPSTKNEHPVEAAHEIDAKAFSFSGGSPLPPKRCQRKTCR
jgi:hypothetical protein